jgi:hypothetical protein
VLYDILYTVLLAWVLAHSFRHEPIGRLLTAPIVVGAFSAISPSRSRASSATPRWTTCSAALTV